MQIRLKGHNYLLRTVLFGLTLILCLSKGNAQFVSQPNPNFRIDINEGCSPYGITITDLVPDRNDTVFYFYRNTLDPRICSQDYQVNFKPCINGEADTVVNQRTVNVEYFNASGRPEEFILIQVNKNAPVGEQVSFLKLVTTIPSLPPQIDVLACGDNSVSVLFDFEADFYDYYEIEFGDNSGIRTIEKNQPNRIDHNFAVGGQYTVTVKGKLDTGDDTNCAITTANVNTIEEAPEPKITRVEATGPNTLFLNYEPLNPTFGYNLEIDFGSGFEIARALNVEDNNTEIEISDNRIDNTNKYYQLRIQASDNCRVRSATSPIVSSVAINQFFREATSTLNTLLSWQTSSDDFGTVDYYRDNELKDSFTSARGDSILVALTNCLELTNSFLQRDYNGTVSKSLTIIPEVLDPIILPALIAPTTEFSSSGIQISWLAGDFKAANYEVLRKKSVNEYTSLGFTESLEWNDNSLPPSASSACYVIRYIDECGNQSDISLETCLPLVGSLKLPSAFSPNGDQINDYFKPLDGVFNEFKMTIYNRWGEFMYETNKPEEGWDGMGPNGMSAPGTYLFTISYIDEDNIPINRKGTFVLIR